MYKKIDMDANVLWVSTSQTSTIRSLIDALKELLTEVNLVFEPSGVLHIQAIDDTRSVITKSVLDGFDTFECEQSQCIGVNMGHLQKFMKMMGNAESVAMYVTAQEPDVFRVRYVLQNPEKEYVCMMPMMDLDCQNIDLNPIDSQILLSIKSTDFHKIIRDLASVAEKVAIKRIGSDLVFETSGKTEVGLPLTIRLRNADLRSADDNEPLSPMDDDDEELIGMYMLHHLCIFTKITTISPQTEVLMREGNMLILRYALGTLGTAQFCAVPLADLDMSRPSRR